MNEKLYYPKKEQESTKKEWLISYFNKIQPGLGDRISLMSEKELKEFKKSAVELEFD